MDALVHGFAGYFHCELYAGLAKWGAVKSHGNAKGVYQTVFLTNVSRFWDLL